MDYDKEFLKMKELKNFLYRVRPSSMDYEWIKNQIKHKGFDYLDFLKVNTFKIKDRDLRHDLRAIKNLLSVYEDRERFENFVGRDKKIKKEENFYSVRNKEFLEIFPNVKRLNNSINFFGLPLNSKVKRVYKFGPVPLPKKRFGNIEKFFNKSFKILKKVLFYEIF